MAVLPNQKSAGLMKKVLVHILTIAASFVFLYVCGRITAVDFNAFHGRSDVPFEKAKITEVFDRQTEEYSLDGSDDHIVNEKILFYAEFKSGKSKGERVEAVQNIDGLVVSDEKEVEKGDLVILSQYEDEYGDLQWIFNSYSRTGRLLVLGVAFAALLVVFGRAKGVNTLVSLGFTCAAVFAVFVPAILSGHNIYLWTVVISAFTIVMTLLIINGPDLKTLTAALGCFSGVLVAGLLTLFMSGALHLTGIVDEDSIFLLQLGTEKPVDLRAIVFAGIVIGALGAVMDVAVSIASSLWEVRAQADAYSRRALFRSGVNIGRDMAATMSSTLILAYIGSSLSTVLLLIAYQSSLLGLLNLEMIVVEILQALVGSIGILFTIPFTALVCALAFSGAGRQGPGAGAEGPREGPEQSAE